MNHYLKLLIGVLALASLPAWAVDRGEVYDPLDLPAVASPLATRANLFGITRAGDRLVVVGQRGFILWSDDQGDSWQQASVPVRSTLLSVYFPTPQLGWAVGHDGVILHSSDAGETWVKQMDGYLAVEQGLAYYEKMIAENPEDEVYAVMLGEMEFAQEQGADRPFFMVWFQDDKVGYAIGAYNFALYTVDGGQSWRPIMELQANEDFRHLFDYEVTANRRYVVGESGELWLQDDPTVPMRAVPSFYDGSFYTVTSTCSGELLLVAGLRGNAYSSEDRGESWSPVDLPTSASVNSSTCLGDDRLVLVTQAGEILVSRSPDTPLDFDKLELEQRFPLSDVVQGRPGEIVVVGLAGVRTIPLN